MEKQGYIKLHRKIIDWEWYDDINTKTLFIHILLMVNFEDKKWRGELVKRGSFITSYQSLATQTGLTAQQVRTSLKKLITTNDVTKVTSNKNTVIIVPNYNLYQSLQQADEHTNNNEVTIKQQTSNKQVTTTKNEKNKKNEKNINISAQSDCKQSSMLEVNEVISLTLNDKNEYPITEEKVNEWKELYPAIDVIQELRKMKGWLDANPNKRKTKKGILRFVNSWLARAQDKGGSGSIQSRSVVNEYPEL